MENTISPPSSVQPKKRKTWLWVLLSIIGVVVILGGMFVWWVFGGGTPKKVANEWLELLASDQVDAAYDMTASAFKEGTSAEQFDVFLEAYPIMTSVDAANYSGIEREVTNGQSLTTLTGTLSGMDGSTSPVKLVLIEEDSTWKIYNVDLRGL